jgi:hypothetical protein
MMVVETSAKTGRALARHFGASVAFMQVHARACGQETLSGFNPRGIAAMKRDAAELSGVRFAGVAPSA